ncbi:MAG: cytochrome c3 family protein [Myxococcota bacterium]|jgi:hypothetical protein|nr:cytochrome c3 family protein [Myxococcota bacterium]
MRPITLSRLWLVLSLVLGLVLAWGPVLAQTGDPAPASSLVKKGGKKAGAAAAKDAAKKGKKGKKGAKKAAATPAAEEGEEEAASPAKPSATPPKQKAAATPADEEDGAASPAKPEAVKPAKKAAATPAADGEEEPASPTKPEAEKPAKKAAATPAAEDADEAASPAKPSATPPKQKAAAPPGRDQTDPDLVELPPAAPRPAGRSGVPGAGEAAVPKLDRPAAPAVDEAARPTVDEAAHPTVDQAARPTVDQAARPAVDEAARPAVDKAPATPAPIVPGETRWTTTPQPLLPRPGPVLSPVVYPPQRYSVRMGHGSHVKDMELTCVQCHRPVLSSRTTAQRSLPNHLPCQDCHSSADPQKNECAQCHRDTEPGGPVAALVPPARLHFSHRSHLARQLAVAESTLPEVEPFFPLGETTYGQYFASWKLPAAVTDFQVPDGLCLSCHANGNAAGVDERVGLPSMYQGCFTCHDEVQAPRRCDLCHPQAPDAPLRLGGRGFREQGLVPRSHDQGWLTGHRDEARFAAASCTACHQRADCLDCHEGRRYPGFHPGNWLLSHGLAQRTQATQCASCHQSDQCRACHQQRGVTQDAFAQPSLMFHPAGWTVERSPRFHGIAGRRDLVSCIACHREPDCARGTGCHQ